MVLCLVVESDVVRNSDELQALFDRALVGELEQNRRRAGVVDEMLEQTLHAGRLGGKVDVETQKRDERSSEFVVGVDGVVEVEAVAAGVGELGQQMATRQQQVFVEERDAQGGEEFESVERDLGGLLVHLVLEQLVRQTVEAGDVFAIALVDDGDTVALREQVVASGAKIGGFLVNDADRLGEVMLDFRELANGLLSHELVSWES